MRDDLEHVIVQSSVDNLIVSDMEQRARQLMAVGEMQLRCA